MSDSFVAIALSVAIASYSGASAADSASAEVKEPCQTAAARISPEYPLAAYSAAQIAALLKRPANVTDLLWNLHRVFEDRLLAQPRFFEDEVLLKMFNGSAIQWFEPGIPHMGDHVIRPTRIARITVGGASNDVKVEVGLSHKCLNQRPTRTDPRVMIPAHTYDSGYIRLSTTSMEEFTLGTVRRTFGPNPGRFNGQCKAPLPLSYPTSTQPGSSAFLVDSAEFAPEESGYDALCEASSAPALPDEVRVGRVTIRLLEDDHTIHFQDQP